MKFIGYLILINSFFISCKDNSIVGSWKKQSDNLTILEFKKNGLLYIYVDSESDIYLIPEYRLNGDSIQFINEAGTGCPEDYNYSFLINNEELTFAGGQSDCQVRREIFNGRFLKTK